MKYKVIITSIMLFAILVLSACGNNNPKDETSGDNIPVNEISAQPVQSKLPYLGEKEITPLFAGLNDISQWINNIKIKDAEYILYIEKETQEPRLDIRSASQPEYSVASFYVEKNGDVNFPDNIVDGTLKNLSDEFKKLKVSQVIYIDFEKMGIDYNVRDIVKGSSVDDVKNAFLNMNREIDTTAVPYQELYNLKDVNPEVEIEPEYENYLLISGQDSVCIEQRGFREVSYYYTEFYIKSDSNYSSWNNRSVLSFLIDDGGKVVGLTFSKQQRQ